MLVSHNVVLVVYTDTLTVDQSVYVLLWYAFPTKQFGVFSEVYGRHLEWLKAFKFLHSVEAMLLSFGCYEEKIAGRANSYMVVTGEEIHHVEKGSFSFQKLYFMRQYVEKRSVEANR